MISIILQLQSICRIYRFGQKKPTGIYRMVLSGTVDEIVINSQFNKSAMSKQVVDQEYIEALSNTELRAMYTAENLDPPSKYNEMICHDYLLNKIIMKKTQIVYDYKDHDSLLEPQFEDTLSDEEKQSAWNNFQKQIQRETGKKFKRQYVTHNFNETAKRPKTCEGIEQPTSTKLDVQIYGFGTSFQEVLGSMAKRNNPHANEDVIWGHDVPNLLSQLFDEMDRKDTTVNYTCYL